MRITHDPGTYLKRPSILAITMLLAGLATAAPVRGHEPGSPPHSTTSGLIPSPARPVARHAPA